MSECDVQLSIEARKGYTDWEIAYVEALMNNREVVLLDTLEADLLRLRHAWIALGKAIENELQLTSKIERFSRWLAK